MNRDEALDQISQLRKIVNANNRIPLQGRQTIVMGVIIGLVPVVDYFVRLVAGDLLHEVGYRLLFVGVLMLVIFAAVRFTSSQRDREAEKLCTRF